MPRPNYLSQPGSRPPERKAPCIADLLERLTNIPAAYRRCPCRNCNIAPARPDLKMAAANDRDWEELS